MQALQPLEYPGEWRGLLSRNQSVDVDRMFLDRARNVEFVGGTPAKRGGSQYVNGWGIMAVAGWTTTTGDVADATGFRVGDVLTVIQPDGVTVGGTVITIKAGNTLTVAPALPFAPLADAAVIARRPMGGGLGNRVDGLFQATFRTGVQKLLAAAGPPAGIVAAGLWNVQATAVGSAFAPALLTELFPSTTVDLPWGALNTGTLTTVQTIRVGDKIQITSAGPAGSVYVGTVTAVVFATRTITVTPNCTTTPLAGAIALLFAPRVAGDTHFVQYANLTHVAAANTPLAKYDGANVYRHGVLPPIEVPAVVAGGGGGARKYRYKFRNGDGGQESEAGPATAAFQLGSTITVTASPDPQVTAIDVYRTLDAGATYFFLRTEANTTHNFADNAADATLGVQMREFLDEPAANTVGVLSLWPQANCLVGIDTALGAVVFSDQFDLATGFLKGESFPPDNLIFVNYDDGDPPRAVVPFFDALLVFKTRSIWRITGTPPDLTVEPLVFRQDLTGVGVLNQKAVVVDQGECIFPAQDGFYSLSRYQGVQQGFQSQRISRPIDKEWERLTGGSQAKGHGVFFRQRRQALFWAPVDGGSEPGEGFVFQFEGQVDGTPHGWALWGVPLLPNGSVDRGTWRPGFTASAAAHGDTDVVYVGTLDGEVLRLNVGTADAGALPYLFDFATSFVAPGGKGRVVRGRRIDVTLETIAPGQLTMGAAVDFGGLGRSTTIDTASTEGFTLDVSLLDVGVLGGTTRTQARMPFSLPGEYHQIVLQEYSARAAFRIANLCYWFQVLAAGVRPKTSMLKTATGAM